MHPSGTGVSSGLSNEFSDVPGAANALFSVAGSNYSAYVATTDPNIQFVLDDDRSRIGDAVATINLNTDTSNPISDSEVTGLQWRPSTSSTFFNYTSTETRFLLVRIRKASNLDINNVRIQGRTSPYHTDNISNDIEGSTLIPIGGAGDGVYTYYALGAAGIATERGFTAAGRLLESATFDVDNGAIRVNVYIGRSPTVDLGVSNSDPLFGNIDKYAEGAITISPVSGGTPPLLEDTNNRLIGFSFFLPEQLPNGDTELLRFGVATRQFTNHRGLTDDISPLLVINTSEGTSRLSVRKGQEFSWTDLDIPSDIFLANTSTGREYEDFQSGLSSSTATFRLPANFPTEATAVTVRVQSLRESTSDNSFIVADATTNTDSTDTSRRIINIARGTVLASTPIEDAEGDGHLDVGTSPNVDEFIGSIAYDGADSVTVTVPTFSDPSGNSLSYHVSISYEMTNREPTPSETEDRVLQDNLQLNTRYNVVLAITPKTLASLHGIGTQFIVPRFMQLRALVNGTRYLDIPMRLTRREMGLDLVDDEGMVLGGSGISISQVSSYNIIHQQYRPTQSEMIRMSRHMDTFLGLRTIPLHTASGLALDVPLTANVNLEPNSMFRVSTISYLLRRLFAVRIFGVTDAAVTLLSNASISGTGAAAGIEFTSGNFLYHIDPARLDYDLVPRRVEGLIQVQRDDQAFTGAATNDTPDQLRFGNFIIPDVGDDAAQFTTTITAGSLTVNNLRSNITIRLSTGQARFFIERANTTATDPDDRHPARLRFIETASGAEH